MSAPPTVPSGDRPRIDLITALWGESFADYFLRYCVRSILAPGNLPTLAARFDCSYQIHLDAAAKSRLESAPGFAALKKICPVELRVHHVPRIADVYAAVNPLNQAALSRAYERRAAMLFLTPDMLVADGSFAHLADLIEGGARAVYVCPPRLDRERLAAQLPSSADDAAPLTMPPRDLVRLGLSCLHRISDLCFWGRSEITTWPHHLFFEAPGEGFVARGFHLHPLYVAPASRIDLLGSTFDTWFPVAACPDYRDVRVVADSDDLMIFEFSAPEKSAGSAELFSFASRCTARFIEAAAAATHLRNGEVPIFIHDRDIGPASKAAAASSDAVYEQIRRKAHLNAFTLFLSDPIAAYERARRANITMVEPIVRPTSSETAFLRAVKDLVGQVIEEHRTHSEQGRRLDKRQVIKRCLRRGVFWRAGIRVGLNFLRGIPAILLLR